MYKKYDARKSIVLARRTLEAAESGDSKRVKALSALPTHESEAVRAHAKLEIARLT